MKRKSETPKAGISRTGTLARVALVAIALAACGQGPSGPGASHVHGTDVRPERGHVPGHPALTPAELARVRAATARYHRLDVALADGYVDIDVFFPGMGAHFLNPGYLDGAFEAERPELLVYWPEKNGRMRLVAVEYAVPLALAPAAPPEGFSGSEDVWFRDENFQLWTLHAWVWLDNPDGMFAAFNPRLP